jgi:hypothetical protein
MSPTVSRCDATALFCSANGANPNAPVPKSSAASAENEDPDFLVQELQKCESQLDAWLNSSAANTEWFVRDPVAALRAAKLGMNEKVLEELEETMRMIAQKLNAAHSPYNA